MSFFEQKNRASSKSKTDINRLWNRISLILAGFVVCGLVVVVAAQVMLVHDDLQSKLDLELWYGEAYTPVLPAGLDDTTLWGNVILQITDYTTMPSALILINGERVADFTDSVVTVRVKAGDEIAVDTSAYQVPIRVQIAGASGNINTELLREECVLNRERVSFGTIIFK